MKMFKKNLWLIFIVSLLICCFVTPSYVYATDNEFNINNQSVRFIGRANFDNNLLAINWPQAGIEFKFTGTKADVYVASKTGTVFLNASIDNNPNCIRFEVTTTNGYQTIVSNLSNVEHTIRLTRSSEAVDGFISISKIRSDASSIAPTNAKTRKMEFIGDSYTAGYGNLELGGTVRTPQNSDAWRSYAGYTMRALNADASIVAFSGKGICMNSIPTTATEQNLSNVMAEQWLYANPLISDNSPHDSWSFDTYKPQVVVVFLGTNDYNGTVIRGSAPDYFYDCYYNFLNNIRAKYPNAHIVACAKSYGCYKEQISAAVTALGGDANRYHYFLFSSFPLSGVNGHPYYTDAQIISNQLVAKIDSIAGVWNVDNSSNEPSAIAYEMSNRVLVNGNIDANNSASEVSIMLIKKDSNFQSLQNADIGYIDQTKVDSNGNFECLFTYTGDIGNYELFVRQIGSANAVNITRAATIYQTVNCDLDIRTNMADSLANVILAVDNSLKTQELTYNVFLLSYDEQDELIDIKMTDNKQILNGVNTDNMQFAIPNGTSKMRAFVWNSTETLIPLCESMTKWCE